MRCEPTASSPGRGGGGGKAAEHEDDFSHPCSAQVQKDGHMTTHPI
jgi:hypothetical protein